MSHDIRGGMQGNGVWAHTGEPARSSPELQQLANDTITLAWGDAYGCVGIVLAALNQAFALGVAHQRSVDAPYLQHKRGCYSGILGLTGEVERRQCTCGLAALVDQTGEPT